MMEVTEDLKKLLGDYEQLILLRMILTRPGIYLHELQTSLQEKFGVVIHYLQDTSKYGMYKADRASCSYTEV